jgi:hypothetical protein
LERNSQRFGVQEKKSTNNSTRLAREEDKTLLDIPVTVGVIGIVLVPWLAAIGAIAALAANCTIVV